MSHKVISGLVKGAKSSVLVIGNVGLRRHKMFLEHLDEEIEKTFVGRANRNTFFIIVFLEHIKKPERDWPNFFFRFNLFRSWPSGAKAVFAH